MVSVARRLDPVCANVVADRPAPAVIVVESSPRRRGTLVVVRARFGTAAVGIVALTLGVALATPRVARADLIDDEATQLAVAPGYKRRLAAVLVLAKSHTDRAVRALASGLAGDREAQIRRVAALALSKSMDDSTPVAARAVAFAALERAAAEDRDRKVRELATRTLERLAALRPQVAVTGAPTNYVHMGAGTDLTSKAPSDAIAKLIKTVRATVTRKTPGVSTEWPGALPTAQQLAASGSHAFLVAPTISLITVSTRGNQTEVECTVSVRVAPWGGTDGNEKWSAQKAASASGTGKAITSTGSAAVATGMRDCVLAVAEEVTAKQVVPFLRKLIAGP